MFIATLFMIFKTWKQSQCPSAEQINTYIQTVECYSAVKRNELSSHEQTQRKQVQITKWKMPIWKGCILYDSNYMTFQKRQNYADRKRISGCQGLGWKEAWISRAWRIFRAGKILCMLSYDGYMSSHICLNSYNVTPPRVKPEYTMDLGWL